MSKRTIYYGYSAPTPWLPRTIAYMTALGIAPDGTVGIHGLTGLQEWQAWNTRFQSLIDAGLDSNHYAMYPTVYGSATNNKWNAINPIDSNAAFRLQFNGVIAHAAGGVTGNGANGYANTFFNDQTVGIDRNDFSLTFYSRTASVSNGVDMGAVGFASNYNWLRIKSGFGDIAGIYDDSNFGFAANFVPNSQGVFTVTRHPSEPNVQKLYHRGVLVGTRSAYAPQPYLNLPLFLMCRNIFGSASNYSSRQYPYFSLQKGVTAAQVAADHTSIQTLMTTLGIAV